MRFFSNKNFLRFCAAVVDCDSAPQLWTAILYRSCSLQFCTAVALCDSAPRPQALAGCGLGTLRAGSYGLQTYAMRTRFAQTLIAFDGLRACSLSGSPLIRPHPVNACGRSVYRVQDGSELRLKAFPAIRLPLMVSPAMSAIRPILQSEATQHGFCCNVGSVLTHFG